MADPAILSNNGIGARLSCTAASTRAAVIGTGDSLILSNPGSTTVYIAVGGSTIDAPVPGTTAGYPIFAGAKEDEIVLDKNTSYYNAPYIAAICDSGQTGVLIVHRVSR